MQSRSNAHRPTNFFWFLLALLGLCVFATTELKANEVRQPKEGAYAGIIGINHVVNLIWEELTAAQEEKKSRGEAWTGQDQQLVVHKYLPLVAPDYNNPPAAPMERLSMAEYLFRSFRAVEAKRHYETLTDRDDLIGRVALI